MNEILQNRIEEAAKKYAKQFEQVGYDDDQIDTIEEAIIYGATLSLQNQWISVEEALPEEEFDDGYQSVFVNIKIDDDTYMLTTDYIRNGKWELNPDSNITHWMPIPEIKGGEK